MQKTVQVLLPLPLTEPFDYKVPQGLDVKNGDIVTVPFGPRRMKGVIWGRGAGRVAEARLKNIIARVEMPAFKPEVRKFIDWTADYCLCPKGAVLNMCLSVPKALEPPKTELIYHLVEKAEIKLTPPREKVIALLEEEGAMARSEIIAKAGISDSVVKNMIEKGLLRAEEIVPKGAEIIAEKEQAPQLSSQQKEAADKLKQLVKNCGYSTTLLDGVTGSGKTEVYFEAIKQALEQGRQTLVLLPEIVLTTQLIARFKKRFGFAPFEWHSNLTPKTRRENWRAIAKGEARLIVGARSALYLPYPELGLIIVDEEHESAYKQEDGVIYHGRDMAVARGYTQNIPVILVSATPSLESTANVKVGKYGRLHLPARHGGAELPAITLVDMRKQVMNRSSWLSLPLKEAMLENLEKGEQTLLYLNRRGYAPLTLCRSCGYRFVCTNCTAWLVEHKNPPHLQCHHCGFTMPMPKACPECEEKESLVACGPGVERLHEEVESLFPEARIAIMTSDSMIDAKSAEAAILAILNREVDIIIGTQMVAKGHHFPHLTLVGVVDADLGLEGGDLRATEKSYQLLHQVAGRAGREELKGRAILQSYHPENQVFSALEKGDREAFIEQEFRSRKYADMPPFSKLAAIIISGDNEEKVKLTAKNLVKIAPKVEGVRVFGPAPAPLALLRGKWRYRLLIKAEKNINLQKLLKSWLKKEQTGKNIRIKVDIDPYSFF